MVEKVDLGPIFCQNAKTYSIPKLLLKAVGITESALDPNAYRFEPAYWEWLKKTYPGKWDSRNPREIAASYGVMQLLYTTAAALALGDNFDFHDLFNPVINIGLGARLLRTELTRIEASGIHVLTQQWPYKIVLARYNGGPSGNPRPDGTLRNQPYVDKVFKNWAELRKAEQDTCYA
jgi:soluble lytic murein transglycosylase-like protein